MFQGNWTCSSCGNAITELPFEPKGTAGLLCRDCHGKKRSESGGGNQQSGERKTFSGDWKCSNCGAAITSLPFEPRDTSNLKCIDCFKQSRG
jgi:CxxC-x17-CxxC domain-containing protein